jgi:biotin-dependent carboxylase-like uncharacterized protein
MTRSVLVEDPGLLTTVQDPGRAGYAHLGVPRSGWLDPGSARLANRLVGNPEGAAVLECLLGSLVLRAEQAVTVAVTGAECPVTVAGRAGAHGAAISVRTGSRVALGIARHGLRAYVALSGGIDVPAVLGSRSTDTLSGLGPLPLTAGVVLPLGRPVGEPSAAQAVRRVPAGSLRLRCTPGPRADWFTPDALEALAATSYVVQPDSDRVGLRLAGTPLARVRTEELPSEGVVLGSVEVPPDGQPLIFLADHPTTGGYPVIAVVDPDDVAGCGQLRPGDRISFTVRRPAPDPATTQ